MCECVCGFKACMYLRASQVALVVRNPLANAGEIREVGLIPGSGRSHEVGNGIPLQYSCLGNPMATVHGVAKGQAPLSTPTHGIDSRDHSKTKTVQRMGFR